MIIREDLSERFAKRIKLEGDYSSLSRSTVSSTGMVLRPNTLFLWTATSMNPGVCCWSYVSKVAKKQNSTSCRCRRTTLLLVSLFTKTLIQEFNIFKTFTFPSETTSISFYLNVTRGHIPANRNTILLDKNYSTCTRHENLNSTSVFWWRQFQMSGYHNLHCLKITYSVQTTEFLKYQPFDYRYLRNTEYSKCRHMFTTVP